MILNAKNVTKLDLPAGKSDHITWDDTLPGFGFRLRAGAGGKVLRSWVAQYRRAGGTRRVKIGLAGAINAEQARIAARKILGAAALGQDPQEERSKRRDLDRLSFRNVVDEYLKTKRVRNNTFRGIRRYLTGPYFKPLHGKPIDTVNRKDIAACLVSIAGKNGKPTAGRARAVLHAFAVWCMEMGYIEHNPVLGTIKVTGGDACDRVLTDRELVAVWRACGDDDFGRIVRLLILTGCRRKEIGGMCWGEMDDDGTWTLPAERSKNKRAHTLPLPQAAWDLIKAAPRMVGRDLVFGMYSKDGFTAWGVSKIELDRRLGDAVAPFKLRDIRRSVATKMADIGLQPHIIEQVLNHQSGHKRGVAGVYNRSTYALEVRNALALWSAYIRDLVDGSGRKVLPFSAH